MERPKYNDPGKLHQLIWPKKGTNKLIYPFWIDAFLKYTEIHLKNTAIHNVENGTKYSNQSGFWLQLDLHLSRTLRGN